MNKLNEYEHTGIDFYTENDYKQRIVVHPSNEFENIMENLDKRT